MLFAFQSKMKMKIWWKKTIVAYCIGYQHLTIESSPLDQFAQSFACLDVKALSSQLHALTQ